MATQIQARLRKEAYVLHARRYLAEDGPMHPRQQQVIDDLAAFARPYLSRLWARLHGRDVWQEPWLRVCALYAAPTVIGDRAVELATPHADDPDRAVAETARWVIAGDAA